MREMNPPTEGLLDLLTAHCLLPLEATGLPRPHAIPVRIVSRSLYAAAIKAGVHPTWMHKSELIPLSPRPNTQGLER